MDDQKRHDDGMAQRRKVLGDAWVDKSIKSKNSFNADFIDLITRHAWGEIWTRPHFDHRTRRVLVIGTGIVMLFDTPAQTQAVAVPTDLPVQSPSSAITAEASLTA